MTSKRYGSRAGGIVMMGGYREVVNRGFPNNTDFPHILLYTSTIDEA